MLKKLKKIEKKIEKNWKKIEKIEKNWKKLKKNWKKLKKIEKNWKMAKKIFLIEKIAGWCGKGRRRHFYLLFFSTTTLYPGGIWSHNPLAPISAAMFTTT
jgi:hypothetical protein